MQVHRLANALSALGHTVRCFSFSPPPADAAYAVELLDWGDAGPVGRKFVPARRFAAIDTTAFDIVHYHGDDYRCRGSRRRVRTFYGSALNEALAASSRARFFYQALFYCFEWVSCLRQGVTAGISRATQRALPLVRYVIPCGIPLTH